MRKVEKYESKNTIMAILAVIATVILLFIGTQNAKTIAEEARSNEVMVGQMTKVSQTNSHNAVLITAAPHKVIKPTTKYVKVDEVKIYNSPSVLSPTVKKVKFAAALSVVSYNANWYKTTKGYCLKKTLCNKKPRMMYVNTNLLNCRKKTSTKAKIDTQLEYRKKVKVLSTNKTWAKIRITKNGKILETFCQKKYLTKNKPAKNSIAGYRKIYIGSFKITFYCSCAGCNGNTHCITASGARLTDGVTIATNPSEISMGTQVYIEGFGTRKAQDTGAFGGKTIDMYVNTSHSNLYSSKYGVKYCKVYKLEKI